MWKVRNIKELVENTVFVYSETEKTLREATNDEPWGPTGAQLTEITEISYEYSEFNNLMKGVWERLKDDETVWRRVYKTLLVIDYLIKFGSERVIEDVREHINKISKLANITYIDDDKKDQSKNIHHRAKEIISLINDKTRLEYERRNALHASTSTPAQKTTIFSDKGPISPPANNQGSIFEKFKTSKIVSGIKSMLSVELPTDKDVDDELHPYTYKNNKNDADPITFIPAPQNTEPKKHDVIDSNIDLFASFENKQKSTINESNNEFGDFSSSQPKEIKNKPNNDLMDFFSIPSGNSNISPHQPVPNMFQNPPTESLPNYGYSQTTSINPGYAFQNSFAPPQSYYAPPQMSVAQPQPQPQSQNLFNLSPQNARNFNQNTRPTSNSTQPSKKALDVDALMNQNIDNLFSSKNTPNSSFNAPNNTLSSSPQSNSFNQSNAFNMQKPNTQSRYF